MNVNIHPRLQQFIDSQVSAGRFESAEAVVTAALAHLQSVATLSTEELRHLMPAVAEGVDELDRDAVEAWDPNAILKDALDLASTRRKQG